MQSKSIASKTKYYKEVKVMTPVFISMNSFDSIDCIESIGSIDSIDSINSIDSRNTQEFY